MVGRSSFAVALWLGACGATAAPPASGTASEVSTPAATTDQGTLDGCPRHDCPGADYDQDRIADVDDRCPREPETYNGLEDDDGCPDETLEELSIACGVPTTERVFFPEGSAALQEGPVSLLHAIADTITHNPQLGVVELHAHADPRERDAVRLTRERGEAVRALLISRGVDPARLVVHAHGADDPMTASRDDDERAFNRRVEMRLAVSEP